MSPEMEEILIVNSIIQEVLLKYLYKKFGSGPKEEYSLTRVEVEYLLNKIEGALEERISDAVLGGKRL